MPPIVTGSEPSLRELFAELSREVVVLIRQQTELARRELSGTAAQVGADALRAVAGVAIAAAGLLVVLAGVVLAVIALGLPPWLAALLVGAIVAGAGYVLARQGFTALRSRQIRPHATVETLKGHAQWARHPTRT